MNLKNTQTIKLKNKITEQFISFKKCNGGISNFLYSKDSMVIMNVNVQESSMII